MMCLPLWLQQKPIQLTNQGLAMVYHSYTDELIHNLFKQPCKCGYVFLYDIWGGFATGACLSSLLICHLESYPLVIYSNIAIENGYL